jgi:transcriptional antiterminator NusG
MDWYVIQAYSGYEQKVKTAIEERIQLANLSEYFGEILVPTEQVVELKSGKKKKTERKFFPGYILIQMELNDDTWQLVKHTPRVSTFVGGTNEKPKQISESDLNNILNRIEVGEEAPRPKTIFEPGEVVRVCDGPFNDFNGVVEEIDYERNQVKVAVQILGRSTPVHLDFMQIEKT